MKDYYQPDNFSYTKELTDPEAGGLLVTITFVISAYKLFTPRNPLFLLNWPVRAGAKVGQDNGEGGEFRPNGVRGDGLAFIVPDTQGYLFLDYSTLVLYC